jgi:hypothetical protein
VKRRVSHFYLESRLTDGGEAASLTRRAGRPLSPRRFLVPISVRGLVNARDIMLLEGLGQLKNPMTSTEIELATSRLVA